MYYEIKAARARRKRVLINITPLIDVLFLLLIFFLVSSTFLEQPSVTVELPSAQTAQPHRIDQYMIVVGREGTIFLNDEPLDEADLLPRLREIYHVKKNVNIVLKADKLAPYGSIITVIDAVRQCGLKKIVALTKIEDEKQ